MVPVPNMDTKEQSYVKYAKSCNVDSLRKLDSIQSRVRRIITDTLKSSPINVQTECDDPPLKAIRQFLADRLFFPCFTIFTGEYLGTLKPLEYVLLLKLRNSLILTHSLSALQALFIRSMASRI